jgi:hypothetical protein
MSFLCKKCKKLKKMLKFCEKLPILCIYVIFKVKLRRSREAKNDKKVKIAHFFALRHSFLKFKQSEPGLKDFQDFCLLP